MTELNPLLLLLGMILAVLAVAATSVILRRARARRRTARRVVERPNSHYTSHVVRERETRHRWHNIDVDRLHEINRGEVLRLLARIEATGADGLRVNERAFLDRMAEIAGTTPSDEDSGTIPADLRHSPA